MQWSRDDPVSDLERERNEAVWSFVNGLDGVIGFLGGDYPRPMTED